VIIIMLN